MTSVDLAPRWVLGEVELTAHPFSVDAEDGVDVGEPELVVEEGVSDLADGDLVREVRHGNRTYVIPVYVEGATLGDVAAGEALLRQEARRAARGGLELLHDPGDGLVPASVYEVQSVRMTPARGDTMESHLVRKFVLTLTCAPFARSSEKTTAAAMVSGSTTVTVDDCSTTTGWTGTRGGAPSPADGPSTIWEAGSVGIMELNNTVGFPPEEWTLTRTGSVDFTATPFLDVEMTTLSAKGGAPLVVSAYLNGSSTALPILQARRIADNSGYYRVTFDTGGVVASSIKFRHVSSAGYGHAWQGLQVRNVARTDVAPGINSHQLARILEVGGTERTPASIHVTTADGVADLGLTFVHTSPEDGSGYAPPLRRWRTSGGTVAAGGPFSGSLEPIATSFVASVPTSAVPKGGYQLVANLRCTSSATEPIYYALRTQLPDGTLMGVLSDKVSVDFTANAWATVVLAEDVTLPTVRTQAGFVKVDIGGAAGIDIDEAWLFRMDDDCALSYVNVTSPNLWLDSADQSSPVPTVWVGDSRETSTHPGTLLGGMGAHVLSPDGTAVFVATAAASNPMVSAEFFKRWHSNAAE